MLFVLSSENGAETVYAPPRESKGQKVGKRTNLETVRLLGAKIGRSIGEARHSGYCSCRGVGNRARRAARAARALAKLLDRQAQRAR